MGTYGGVRAEPRNPACVLAITVQTRNRAEPTAETIRDGCSNIQRSLAMLSGPGPCSSPPPGGKEPHGHEKGVWAVPNCRDGCI